MSFLRDIRKLGCSEEFSQSNFGLAKDTWVLAYSLKWRLSKTRYNAGKLLNKLYKVAKTLAGAVGFIEFG